MGVRPPDGFGESSLTSVIILAAGGSTRMGHPKSMLRLDNGQTLLESHLEAYRGQVDELVVIGGAEMDRLRPACKRTGAKLFENPRWKSTMPIDSLRVGAERISGECCIVAPVDTVPVSEEDLSALLFSETPAVLAYASRPGHPVILGPEELARLNDPCWTGTLRDLLGQAVPVKSQRSSICLNMNRPQDWEHWRSSGFS